MCLALSQRSNEKKKTYCGLYHANGKTKEKNLPHKTGDTPHHVLQTRDVAVPEGNAEFISESPQPRISAREREQHENGRR
jgi:hypothetical protein